MDIDSEKEVPKWDNNRPGSRMFTFRLPEAMEDWLKVKCTQTGLRMSEIILLCLSHGAMANANLKLPDHIQAYKVARKKKKKKQAWIVYDGGSLKTLDVINAHLYDDKKERVLEIWDHYEKEKLKIDK